MLAWASWAPRRAPPANTEEIYLTEPIEVEELEHLLPQDVQLLVRYFVQKFAAANAKEITGADDETQVALMEPAWPGIVRELERAVILARTPRAILQTLEASGGSTSLAAHVLRISPRTIQYKLKQYRSEST